MPPCLTEAGRADLINPALTALNLGQLPASLLLIVFPRHFERRAWPFVLAALIALLSIAGILWTTGVALIASAAVLGFTAGGAFALGLTMPPLLSPPQEVARVSAAMFTISYTSAVAFSVLSGLAWDVTGTARFAFLPIALSALPMIVLAPTIPFGRVAGSGGQSQAP